MLVYGFPWKRRKYETENNPAQLTNKIIIIFKWNKTCQE